MKQTARPLRVSTAARESRWQPGKVSVQVYLTLVFSVALSFECWRRNLIFLFRV